MNSAWAGCNSVCMYLYIMYLYSIYTYIVSDKDD